MFNTIHFKRLIGFIVVLLVVIFGFLSETGQILNFNSTKSTDSVKIDTNQIDSFYQTHNWHF